MGGLLACRGRLVTVGLQVITNAETGHKVLFAYICGSSENGAPANGISKILLGLLC